jgi:hypothetical protein
MELTELMLREGTNRLRAGRFSRHRPEGEIRRVPDDRMLWKWTAMLRFAPFPTNNSVLSNVGELRRQSRHVVMFSVKKRPPMTRRDGASEFPHSNERCKSTQCGMPRTPTARGPSVAEFKYGPPNDIKRHFVTCV